MSLTGPINMTEALRRGLVKNALDSVHYLENFSQDETYQSHLYHMLSLLKFTEMALSIERFRRE